MSKNEPTPQAVTAWKKKADQLVTVGREIATATATLEEALAPIRAEYEPDILALKKREAELSAEVKNFGTMFRETLFAESATIETRQAKIMGKSSAGTVVVAEGHEKKEVLDTLNADRGLKKFLKVTLALDLTGLKKVFTNGGEDQISRLEEVGLAYEPGYSVTVKSKEA